MRDWPGGSSAVQLLASAERRAQLREGIHRERQRRRLTADERDVDADRNVPPEDLERALRAHRERQRAFERALDLDLEQVARALAQLHAGEELGEEVERQQLDQHVEAGLARHVEAVRCRVQVRARAELHGVRSQREVGFAARGAGCRRW